jgi:Fe-S cluster assembly ATP-binding protein
MIDLKNLKVNCGDKEIIRGLSLKINSGEIHAIMGPNGAGKSTLAQALIGNENYQVVSGDMLFNNENILNLSIEDRALRGIFLAFQYPIEIPGVNNTYLLRASLNAKRKYMGLPQIDAFDFLKLIREVMKKMNIPEDFINRYVNQGFSGGEKKKNEILQMMLLEPSFCILDETDSGLDVDALKIVAEGVNAMRSKDRSILIITHYQRLLELIKPDYVHVLSGGTITKSGDHTLAEDLDKRGFDWVTLARDSNAKS